MTWIQRYGFKSLARNSVWVPPVFGLVAALLLHQVTRRIDAEMGWKADVGVDGARALLGALASSMLTFIVFSFTYTLAVMGRIDASVPQLSP